MIRTVQPIQAYEQHLDYICIGFNEGRGKYVGMAGSIRGAVIKDGKVVEVCSVSGMMDGDRKDFWDNKDCYIGQVFEATGKAIFPSGALRHPYFRRFREDKLPGQCVWPRPLPQESTIK